MKKQLFLILVTVALAFGIKAQTNIANYTFASSLGTYIPITGGTTYLTSWDTQVSSSIPLGGTFTFGGVNHTSIFIYANGYITFGTGSSFVSPLSNGAAFSGVIAAFAQDGNSSAATGASPKIIYKNIGGSTGEFVVQYTDHANFYNKATERLNFQIRLNLATDEIKIVYGNWSAPGSSLSGNNAQIGIRGNSTNWTTNVNNITALDAPVGTSCNWDDAVTGSANNSTALFSQTNSIVRPTNGLTLTWSPPVNSALAPVRSFGSINNITGTSAELTWLAPSAATQYNVQYRNINSCTWTNFTGNPVTTPSVGLTGLTSSTTYQVRVQSSDGTNDAIWSHIPDANGTGDGYNNPNGSFTTIAVNCTTTPFAGSISGPANVLDGSNSLYSVSPAVGNIQWYGSFNSQGPWSPINSATLATNQSIEAIGSGTVYYIAVASSPACVDDTTDTPYQVDIQATAYCQPAPSSVDGDGIINVNVKNGAINNSTGIEANNYGNYTSLIANVNRGVNIPVAITFSTDIYDYNTKIWIDFNNDFDFNDAGEEVYSGLSAGTSPTTLTATIYIPLTVSLGNHVMRIGAADEDFPDPCYTGSYGVFEDYTLNVLTAPPCTLTPVAGTISGPSAANESSTNTYSVSPYAGQLQWYSSFSASGPWAAIASATMANQPIVAVASGSVYYTVIAYSPGCANDTASALLTVITKTAYCVPNPTSVDGQGIINVNINSGNINNSTGAEVGNYGNYTSLVANTNQGDNMPVAITFSTATFSYDTKIWIDFNNDFDFDDIGEEVFSGPSGTVSPNTLTASIAIPSSAPAGNHVLRIGAIWSGTPTPCFSSAYGTYEDYSVNIAAVSCTPAPTIVDGSGIIHVNVNNGAINNPSGDEAPTFYGNYTSLVANVNQGTNMPVAITYSTGIYDYYTNIWIDFNNNGDFTDAGENVYSGISSTVTPNTLNALVYIPLTAALGNHVMRIGGADEIDPDPCFAGDYAAFEDYTINILTAPACTLTPVAGNISGPTSVSVGTTNFYTISPSAGQLQWYSASNANGPWAAINAATSNSQAISATTSGTVYYNVVAYNPGCVNDTANAIFMSVITETAYCIPAPTSIDGQGIINVDVNVGAINNPSGAEGGNYGNYTSLVANVNAGATIPVAITFSTNGYDYNTKIWIDLNNDMDFTDAGEEVYSGVSSSVTPNTLNANIIIPLTTLSGNYVMRIGATDEAIPTPCYTGAYGTFEDYSLNVTAPTCSPSPISVDGEGIVNVNINNGAINNPSLSETNNYGNYTSLVANVFQGVNMPVAVTFSTDIYDYNTRIWIDFNNDGDFIDAGEHVYTGLSSSTSPNTLNALVSIPSGAPLGNHVIRIGATDTGTPTPCYTGSYGTYEDYTINIQTPPACTLTPAVGVISGPTAVNNGSINSYTVSPAIGNVQWYVATNPNGPWMVIPSATLATNQTITATSSGIVYYTAVASGLGCVNDTANNPIAVNINYLGDNVCTAIPLSIGTSPKYNLYGATVEAGEVRPRNTGFTTNTGWGNSNITNTMWFTFLAPASGNVSVQAPIKIGSSNDAQIAIWDAASCTDLIGQATPTAPIAATLVAANDDDTAYVAHDGVVYSSWAHASCLTPGLKYYIQLDTYFAASAGDSTQIVITDLGAFDPSYSGLQSLYCLSNISSSLTPVTNGGVFTVNSGTASITSFTPNTVGNYTVTYSINGCKTTSVTSVTNGPTVSITPSSNSVCDGFSANLSANGATSYTWLPSNNTGVTETATPSVTTTYTLLGNTSGGCAAMALFTLSVTALPSVMISASSTTICPNTTATLSAVSTASVYTWSDGSTNMSTVVSPSVSTDYSVTVVNSCGSSTGTVSITISNIVNVNATTSNTLLCSGQSAILTANGASSYTWMPMGAIGQTVAVAPSSPTTYTLLGQSSCGSAGTTITQNVSLCTDINAFVNESLMSIYPNPNYGMLHIVLNRALEGTTTINLFDALGKLVMTEKLTQSNASITTTQLEAGMYFYELINQNNKLQIGKIIKQ